VVNAWTSRRTVAEIVELASLMRIPVAEVSNGESLPEADHLVQRKWLVENPRGGFLQPDVPYTLGASAGRRPVQPAPRLGEHTVTARSRVEHQTADAPVRPFTGLRVVDFTANWAGPIITQVLGIFGADIIKIESAARPDALRFNTIKPLTEDLYWEWSPIFHGTNTTKRDLTLDMAGEKGRELAGRLIPTADVVVENSSPRVMDSWGLSADAVHELNPKCVYLRAPAYGLEGPWTARVGYAQTIEMTSGLAWLTGYRDGLPVIPNSPCDPVAGIHALIALLLGLEHRRVTDEGMLVEAPMVGGALNFAAEQIIERTAYGALLQRDGNRGPSAAPQGCYRTSDTDLPYDQGRFVVISIETDEHWKALRRALGDPAWACADELVDLPGRRAAHDRLDVELGAWCATRSADEVVATLWPAGVPVAKVLLGYEQQQVEQIRERGWFQTVDNPVNGPVLQSGFPARFSGGPAPTELHTSPAPRLGQHNQEILSGVLGLSDREIEQLAADRVIGTRPGGGSGW
jgi:crotonobetainyl-CoA:carnitine CoA-transferase CaiB-like acyl-CoA transferase